MLSGTSNCHIATDQRWFTTYTSFQSFTNFQHDPRQRVEVIGIGDVVLELAPISSRRLPMTLLLKNVLHAPSMTVNLLCWPILAFTSFFVSQYHIEDHWNRRGTQPWHRPGQYVLGHWNGLLSIGFVDDPCHLKLRLKGQVADETHLDLQLEHHWDNKWPWEESGRWNQYRGNHRRQHLHLVRAEFDMVQQRITNLLNFARGQRLLFGQALERHNLIAEGVPNEYPSPEFYKIDPIITRSLSTNSEQETVIRIPIPRPTLEASQRESIRQSLGPAHASELDRWLSRHPVNIAHDLLDWPGKWDILIGREPTLQQLLSTEDNATRRRYERWYHISYPNNPAPFLRMNP